ncbi:hypothetical protein ACSLOT_27940, partial [Escherichia coli]
MNQIYDSFPFPSPEGFTAGMTMADNTAHKTGYDRNGAKHETGNHWCAGFTVTVKTGFTTFLRLN